MPTFDELAAEVEALLERAQGQIDAELWPAVERAGRGEISTAELKAITKRVNVELARAEAAIRALRAARAR